MKPGFYHLSCEKENGFRSAFCVKRYVVLMNRIYIPREPSTEAPLSGKNNMKNYRLTIIGLSLALLMLALTFGLDLDLFEMVTSSLRSMERLEVDEFIFPVLVVSLFAYLDQRRRIKAKKIEYEKIVIYKAMLSSTYHILNNFLNQIQLFKLTAQKTPGFNPRVLTLYDEIVESANTQLEALGNITEIDAGAIHESVAPKSES